MKTQILLLSVSLAVAGVSSAHAQISRPVANGTTLGAIAGAFIGGHNHDRWGEGALIGAAAGALIGAVIDQPPRAAVYQTAPCSAPVTMVRTVPASTCKPAPAQVVYVPAPQPTRVVYIAQPQPTRVVYVPARPAPTRVVVVEQSKYRHRPAEVVYVAPSYPRW